jgi:hypothetical protein
MKKTLAIILNYNLPDFTDSLYNQLKPFESSLYDLVVLDNGSPPGGRSKYTGMELPENVYFGGGLVASMEYILDNTDKYDSLLFLNSDLSVIGYKWVESLREVMFNSSENVGVVSPSIIQQGYEQIHWPHMRNWCSKNPRKVKWVDFQSPLINIDVLKEIKKYPDGFWPGYGYDVYTGYICEQMNYSTYVLDYTYAAHYKGATLKHGNPKMQEREHNELALKNMYQCFYDLGLGDVVNSYRHWSLTYTI